MSQTSSHRRQTTTGTSAGTFTGSVCKQMRAQLSITQDEVAELAGVSVRCLRKFELCRVRTRRATAVAILGALRRVRAQMTELAPAPLLKVLAALAIGLSFPPALFLIALLFPLAGCSAGGVVHVGALAGILVSLIACVIALRFVPSDRQPPRPTGPPPANSPPPPPFPSQLETAHAP